MLDKAVIPATPVGSSSLSRVHRKTLVVSPQKARDQFASVNPEALRILANSAAAKNETDLYLNLLSFYFQPLQGAKGNSYKQDLIQLFRLIEDCMDLEATVAAVSYAHDSQDQTTFQTKINTKLEELREDFSSTFTEYDSVYGKYLQVLNPLSSHKYAEHFSGRLEVVEENLRALSPPATSFSTYIASLPQFYQNELDKKKRDLEMLKKRIDTDISNSKDQVRAFWQQLILLPPVQFAETIVPESWRALIKNMGIDNFLTTLDTANIIPTPEHLLLFVGTQNKTLVQILVERFGVKARGKVSETLQGWGLTAAQQMAMMFRFESSVEQSENVGTNQIKTTRRRLFAGGDGQSVHRGIQEEEQVDTSLPIEGGVKVTTDKTTRTHVEAIHWDEPKTADELRIAREIRGLLVAQVENAHTNPALLLPDAKDLSQPAHSMLRDILDRVKKYSKGQKQTAQSIIDAAETAILMGGTEAEEMVLNEIKTAIGERDYGYFNVLFGIIKNSSLLNAIDEVLREYNLQLIHVGYDSVKKFRTFEIHPIKPTAGAPVATIKPNFSIAPPPLRLALPAPPTNLGTSTKP